MQILSRRAWHAVSFVLLGCVCTSRAQQSSAPQAGGDQQSQQQSGSKDSDPQWREARDLYRQGKFVGAMPLFEKYVADHPNDVAANEGWAWCINAYSATVSDPALRKKSRARAKAVARKAKELGDNSQLLLLLLDIPDDGGETAAYSSRKDVDEVMRAAEADFARGDLDKAKEGYLRVILMEPSNYDAPLFLGDVFFKQKVYGSAGEWYASAIRVNPDRETAYRYWGDSLSALGSNDEARSKYIEGVVADPYQRTTWNGLNNWLQRNKLQPQVPQLKTGASVADQGPGHMNINIDPSVLGGKNDLAGPAWIGYGMNIALWHNERFAKEFPNETKYRRSLKEESESLSMVVSVIREQKGYKKHSNELDPGLQTLIKIQEAGFMDPYVLLFRADDGIAQDYDSYRTAHRDLIRRYLDEFVVPKAPN